METKATMIEKIRSGGGQGNMSQSAAELRAALRALGDVRPQPRRIVTPLDDADTLSKPSDPPPEPPTQAPAAPVVRATWGACEWPRRCPDCQSTSAMCIRSHTDPNGVTHRQRECRYCARLYMTRDDPRREPPRA